MLKFFPKFAVYAILFLTPLFTLPFTADVLDFPKHLVILFLAGVGTVFWLWNAIGDKKIGINLNLLNFLPLAFLAITLVSAIFSLYRYGSLWGWPLPVAESFAAALGLALFYLLAINNFKKDELPKMAAVLAVSAALAAICAIFQSVGIYLLPFFDYAKNPSLNTVGAISGLALFCAVVLALIFPLAFAGGKIAWIMRVCAPILFLALVFFNGLATFQFPANASGAKYEFLLAPWIALAIGSLAVMIFALNRAKPARGNAGIKNFAFALFFVSVLFLIFNVFARPVVSGVYENLGAALKVQVVNEITLRQSAAIDVAVGVLKQSPQNLLIGSGPGTFAYGYVKFKPAAANWDNLGWNLVFGAPSEMINRAATLGALGFLILLAIIIAWAIEGFRALAKEEGGGGYLPLAVFSGWLAVAAALFYSPFNLTLTMVFWFLLAAAILLDEKKRIVLPLDTLKKSYAISLIFAATLLMMLGLLVQSAKHYYAETEYLGAMKAFAQKDIAGAIKKLEAAADATDRSQDNYLVSLSQAYLALAEEEIGKSEAQDAAAIQAAAPYLEGAVRSAMQSTESANPNSSANWALRAHIYRKLIGVSEGFDAWALEMYQNAIKLEPTNPLLFNEVGQIHIIKNDLEKAKIAFEKAVEMMPQYIDARYYLALIADRQGNKDEAIKQLEAVWMLLPADDAASKENVAKAIESLKQGGSIGGQQNQPAPQDLNLEPESEAPEDENGISDDLEKVLREGEMQFSSPENSEAPRPEMEE